MSSFPLKTIALAFVALCSTGCDQKSQEPPAAGVPAPVSGVVAPGSDITLLHNARIYTFDHADTVLDTGSLAFSANGEIKGVGKNQAMLEAFRGAQVLEMDGRTVLPGLIDSHAHLYGLAQSFTRADLVGSTSKQDVLRRLQEFAANLPQGAWLLGRGWDQNDWPEPVFPTRADLDTVFPDRPVWLRRIDGHAAWANSLAMAQADRDLAGDWQVEGGHIHRDDQGQPSGIFIDKAMVFIERTVPPDSPELMRSALDLATRQLVSLGLTAVHEAGADRAVLQLYQDKISAGEMPIRVYAMADGMNETARWLCESGFLDDPSGRLLARSVKLYADGALGSRGAALLEDYSDEPGNRGLLFLPPEALRSQIRDAVSCGLQVGVHAIGDRANRAVLDAFAMVLPDFPDDPGRHRIEHAQVLAPADIPRFGEMGIIAAMQPTHATSDMYWAEERLGPERVAGAYAWASLADSGAQLAFGSDFPVERVDPLLGIYAAVTRRDLEQWPAGGWLPQERLSRTAAVRAFTLDAAWAGFMENETGSLETGKKADFIVLDRDLMQVPETEIPHVLVDETWVDGRRVFLRDSAP